MRNLLLSLALVLLAEPVFAQKKAVSFEELTVVDCLLPGQLKSLGRRRQFETPRRATRTTALDCAIRGGEFTAYDRANYQTALKVWQQQADEGDAEAQYYVGQIHERGLGKDPDYPQAALWYEKAAAQNHRAAQVSLGNLYEQGLGVTADPAEALKWYRRSTGASEDLIVLEAADYKSLVASQQELTKREEEIAALKREIEALKQSVKPPVKGNVKSNETELKLLGQLHRLELELASRRRAVTAITVRAEAPPPPLAAFADLKFGGFYALVIGNSKYRNLPSVPSAEPSAKAVADLLTKKYGFRVTLLLNADRLTIMNALNTLRESLKKTDNLVVFYAGHGQRDPSRQRGWWQPADADAEARSTWLSNQDISEHLNLIPAHNVLVLADSCYEGALTRSSVSFLPRGMSPAEQKRQIIELQKRRSRLALTSGVESPVPQANASGVSRFTAALVQTLDKQRGMFEAWQVYRGVNDTLTAEPGSPAPNFAPIRFASHEGGHFIFVRKGS